MHKIKGHWFWGNTKQFASSTLGFVQKCMSQFNDICHARIGFKDFYLPLNVELADYVLRINNKNYKKSFAYSGLKVFLGNGLLTNEGQEWLAQRRLIQPSFNKEAIAKLRSMMVETTDQVVDSWNGKVDLSSEANRLTRTIITKAIFGEDLNQHPDLGQLPEILNTFRTYGNDKMKNPLKLPLWIPNAGNKMFKQHFEIFRGIIYHGIEKRKQNPEGYHDILALFIHLQDEDGNQMNAQQVFDEVATLFIAGQETTTNALLFALYHLDRNPDKRERLIQKLKNETEDAAQYLENCCLETLRISPPAWAISREAIADDQIGEQNVKAGDTIFLPIYAYHRNKEVWENPDEFVPERFETDYPKKWFMPFGTGPRFCIGNHFAQMEMEIVLKKVFTSKNYKIIQPQEMKYTTLMTLAPKESVLGSFE